EEDALERGPPRFVGRGRDGPGRRSADTDQRAVQAAETIPGRRDEPVRSGWIGVIRDDPGGNVSCGVRSEACHGRRGGRLVRGADQDAGPVRDKCLRRGKSEATAAAGYEVNPVA